MQKILIVEDNRDLASLLKLRLEKEGFSVDIVTGGLALLAYLRGAEEPDALILDLYIPEKSGVELLGSITSRWLRTKIFIYSAQVRWKATCLRYPTVIRFFSKDENSEDLVAAVKEELTAS